MTLSISMSNIFLLLGSICVSSIQGKYYLVETEGAPHTPIKHDSDYRSQYVAPPPCVREAKDGRLPNCEKEPFPNPYNKNTNADAVQAKRQHYWTYNNKTGKCEEFKGEGYWCQDDETIYNMYTSEDECGFFCLPQDHIFGDIRESCLIKKTLPKEPCKAAVRWTLTKERKCEKYEAMGYYEDNGKNNQFESLDSCEYACPNCDDLPNPPDLMIPCQVEADIGRNPKCEKEPFPYAYNKSNNADLVQAKRQPFWTYNKMTGKCELFKGEGYWCQDDYTGYNLYDEEQSCRVNCMLKDTSKATAIEMVKWRTHLRPEECYHKVILPKEPCKPIERWTLTKNGCEMYAAMGGKLAYKNQKINQFGYSDDCKYGCPKCAHNTSPPTTTTSTIKPKEEYGPAYCYPGYIKNPEPGKDGCIPTCKPNYKIYEEGSDSCCTSSTWDSCCHTIGDWNSEICP